MQSRYEYQKLRNTYMCGASLNSRKSTRTRILLSEKLLVMQLVTERCAYIILARCTTDFTTTFLVMPRRLYEARNLYPDRYIVGDQLIERRESNYSYPKMCRKRERERESAVILIDVLVCTHTYTYTYPLLTFYDFGTRLYKRDPCNCLLL